MQAHEDLDPAPTPLLIEIASHLPPGRALDLACGAGRNALWLARHGWKVTAVDGAPAAIEILRQRAAGQQLEIDARIADIERRQYSITPSAWDLIGICYYLDRDLFEPARLGVKSGGIVLAIVHITAADEAPTHTRLRPGELAGYFSGWEILHRYEGQPHDAAHQRPVAEIVAQRPSGNFVPKRT